MDGVRAAAGVVRTTEGEDQTTLFHRLLMDLIYLFVSQTAAPGSPFSCNGEPSPAH